MRKKWHPALVLFLLAPTIGELVSGSAPPLEFFNPILFISMALMYGCGALLCRELVVRWRKGWPSLLLLGMAYGIYEEGLVVRSFFSPTWQDLDDLGVYGRALGVNWVWTEHLIHYHALVSICSSVALVEILFPRWANRPWLSRRTWRGCWAALLGWIPLGFVAFKYNTPPLALLATVLSIAGLIGLARIIPERVFAPRAVVAVPRPRRFWALGFVGLTAYFLFVYIMADSRGVPYPITMAILLLWDLLILFLARRWSGNGYAWDDRHKLALTAGGFSFLIVFGGAQELAGSRGMSIVALLTALGLWRLGQRVRQERPNTAAIGESAF